MPKADHDHDPDSRRAAPAPTAVRAPDHTPRSLARRLRLQQFAIFEQVVEAGSILAASRELALTQPALSKAIHELEQHLGGALFARGKRGVALTEFGQLFERRAKALMSELRYMAEDINAWQSGSAGHVVVGSLIVASSTLLPKAILRLRAQAPGIVVTVRVGSNATLFPAR
ncbi:MAG: LysR family transcriptional regulator, partial [Burkholderiaceae bacterium]|nr:LysR family transcriptional regulator [Burkholderiaceae bacterium]